MGIWLVLTCLLIGIVVGAALVVERFERGFIRDALRDGLPLALVWVGLKIMSRKCREEVVYGMQHRHIIRGLPDLHQKSQGE